MRQLSIAFGIAPRRFKEEKSRVLFAMQFLKGEPSDSWFQRWETTIDQDAVRWSTFSEHLLDQISDPINRTMEAAGRYQAARQQQTQTVVAFATEMATLEGQLPKYSEEHRVQHLFAKLRPELRRVLTNHHKIPTKRDELISLAATMERNNFGHVSSNTRIQTAPNRQGNPLKRPPPGPSQVPASLPPRPAQPSLPYAHTPNMCYNCWETGHIRPDCKNASRPRPAHIPPPPPKRPIAGPLQNPNTIPVGTNHVSGNSEAPWTEQHGAEF